jgi:hypothetical protein
MSQSLVRSREFCTIPTVSSGVTTPTKATVISSQPSRLPIVTTALMNLVIVLAIGIIVGLVFNRY